VLVDGYIRVSQVGDRSGETFLSPVRQREQIEAWARRNGALIVQMFEELDESGGRRDRPFFQRSIERVEAGETNGVVVAKLDRFARSLTDTLEAVKRIRGAGGLFVSVEEGFDLRTDVGRHMLREWGSWAEFDLDRVRSNWRYARERAVARGVYLAPCPVGYRKHEGRLLRDPEVAPFVAEAFRRRGNRASVRQVGLFLESRGVRTARGNPGWAEATISSMLRNRVYLGESRSGEFLNAAAHEPLVDADVWHAAQAPNDLPRRRSATPGLLAGLLRCAACRRRMCSSVGRYPDGRAYREYYCRGSSAAGVCPQPAVITGSLVEPYVEAVFWRELVRKRRVVPRRELETLQARAASAETALLGYRDNPRVIQAIGSERFAEGLALRQERLERELLTLAAARARAAAGGPGWSELRHAWSWLSVTERREALGGVIECAFVDRGRKRPEERIAICLRGEAPIDLPGRGRSSELRRFDPTDCRGRSPVTLTSEEPRWPVSRVRRQLEGFVGRRDRFPTCEEFQRAGLSLLFRQVQIRGGERWWARQLGIDRLPNDANSDWSAERIRHELAPFLKGRTQWPTAKEFRVAGYGRLRLAIAGAGGAERWAREFGLPMPARSCGSRHVWTDDRIEEVLCDFLGGRTRWPGDRAFRAAGLNGLTNAMLRSGGRAYWARRLAFTQDTQARVLVRDSPYIPPPELPEVADPRMPRAKRPGASVWSAEMIVDAIRRWADETGCAPRAYEWDSIKRRPPGPGGRYPATSNVVRTFGSWSSGLEAAGFESGGRGHSPRVSVRADAPVPRFPPAAPRRSRAQVSG
jgi:DNA invertase Pin-like site-specific DNA recombinase